MLQRRFFFPPLFFSEQTVLVLSDLKPSTNQPAPADSHSTKIMIFSSVSVSNLRCVHGVGCPCGKLMWRLSPSCRSSVIAYLRWGTLVRLCVVCLEPYFFPPFDLPVAVFSLSFHLFPGIGFCVTAALLIL